MKCSVELPIAHLDQSHRFDFDFVIASTCLEHSEYLEYFKNCQGERFTILDNGAFETGEAINDEEYIALVTSLQPDVVVIPDVARNPKASLERGDKFLGMWRKYDMYAKFGIKLMGVVQADGSLVDAAYFAGVYANTPEVTWVGIPYIASLDRHSLTNGMFQSFENIHILGCPSFPEALSLCDVPNVKSIDSSLPVKVTKAGKRLEHCYTGFGHVAPDEILDDISLLEHNLNLFTAACHGDCQIERMR